MSSNVHILDQLGELNEAYALAKRNYETLRDQVAADFPLGKHEGDRYSVSIFNSRGEVRLDQAAKDKLKELTSPQYYAAHTSQSEFVVVKPARRKGVV